MTELEREIKKYSILGFTRVRGVGSHGRRCLWDICGKPSLQRVIEAVLGSKYIEKHVIVTEDDKIAEVAKGLRATVIRRPYYTSQNFPRDFQQGDFKRMKPRSLIHAKPEIYTNSKSYTLYCLEEAGYVPDLTLSVDANLPMISTELINKVIEAFFKDEEAVFAAAFHPIPPYISILNPRMKRIVPLYTTQFDRQEALLLYRLCPIRLDGLPARSSSPGPKVASVLATEEAGLDIHDEEDLFRARCYMKRRLLKEGKEVKWEIGQDSNEEKQKN